MGNKEQKTQLDSLDQQVQRMGHVVERIRSLPGEINKKIDEEKKGHLPLKNWNLSDIDTRERVMILLNEFNISVNRFDYGGVSRVWESMINFSENRKNENEEKKGIVVRKTEEEKKYNFKGIVRKNLPKFPIITVDDGSMAISTYRGGIGGFLSAETRLLLVNACRGNKKYKNILDDKITMSPNWVRISNQFGRGDERIREQVLWNETDDLIINYESPAFLDFINKPKAVISRNPEPFAPVGVLVLYRGQSQSNDVDIPEIANVLVDNPKKWVDTFNQLKEKMSEMNLDEDGLLREQVYLEHFWRYGLEGIVKGPNFRHVLPDMANMAYQDLVRERKNMRDEIQRRKPNLFGRK